MVEGASAVFGVKTALFDEVEIEPATAEPPAVTVNVEFETVKLFMSLLNCT